MILPDVKLTENNGTFEQLTVVLLLVRLSLAILGEVLIKEYFDPERFPSTFLVVEEWETRDQVLAGFLDKVVAHQFPKGEHGESPVVDLVRLARERRFIVHFNGKRSVVSSDGGGNGVINGSNGKEGRNPKLKWAKGAMLVDDCVGRCQRERTVYVPLRG